MTNRKTHVTPGRVMKTQARAGMIIAALFLLFGLVFGFVIHQETPKSETGLSLLISGFVLIWSASCLALIVFYWRLQTRRSGPNDVSLVDLCGNGLQTSTTAESDFDSRLRKLERLKTDGLISEQEYRKKRAVILAQDW